MPPRALVTSLALAASGAAQTVLGGDIVVADYQSATIWRVTPAGVATVLHQGPPLRGPSGVAVLPGRDVVIADFNASTVFVLPLAGGPPLPLATGLSGPIRVAAAHDGSVLVTELTASRLSSIDRGTGLVTPIWSGAPLQRPFGVAVDGDGTPLVVDDRAMAVFGVTPSGVSTFHQGAPFRLPQGIAVLPTGDFAVIDGLVDAVFLVPRGGATPTPLVGSPPLGNPCGIHGDFEGGLVVSESGTPAGNRVVQVDSTGSLTIIAQGSPFQNLEACARVPRLGGPTRLPRGGTAVLDLEIPETANRPYVLFASASLFPGFGMPGADPRRSPINPDGLFFASLTFPTWTGVLSASGRAIPSLLVPPLPLPPGFALFVQGVAVDFAARPNGVAALSNAHVLPY